jgi:hypothetical protein
MAYVLPYLGHQILYSNLVTFKDLQEYSFCVDERTGNALSPVATSGMVKEFLQIVGLHRSRRF